MNGLTTADRLYLAEALAQAYASATPEGLAVEVARIATRFLRSELTVVGHRHPDQRHTVRWLPEEVDLLRHNDAYEDLVATHPVRRRFRENGGAGPIRLSDCMSLAAFKASGLYLDYFRHFGVTRLAAVYVPLGPRSHMSLGVSRSGPDFTERELAGLAFLRPHLEVAHRREDEARRLAEMLGASENELTRLARGIVLLDHEGRFLDWTGSAAALWARYTGADLARGAAPAPDLAQRLARAGARAEVRGASGTLHIERAGDAAREHLVLREVAAAAVAEPGWHAPGLTRRESEVLHWIGEGKTNREIGVILELSPATVRKHIEHIFAKIGVENRSSATRWLFEARSA